MLWHGLCQINLGAALILRVFISTRCETSGRFVYILIRLVGHCCTHHIIALNEQVLKNALLALLLQVFEESALHPDITRCRRVRQLPVRSTHVRLSQLTSRLFHFAASLASALPTIGLACRGVWSCHCCARLVLFERVFKSFVG